MRIYVAGPMTGFPDLNYPAFTNAAVDLLRAGHTPVSPAGDRPRCASWQDFMRESLHDLAGCDGVAVLHGWQKSKGARLEVHVAAALDMPVRSVEDWTAALTTEPNHPGDVLGDAASEETR